MADYANGSLTIPRVKVVWGPEDITANVYDVRVSLDEQGQTPTGSMKWIPTSNFYAKYVEWITKYKEWTIMITFYYIGGGSITFEFYWAGQSETYGNEMEITVKLVSLLDGLVNANFFASAQTNVGEKGINFSEAASKLQQQFGIIGVVGADGQPLNILRYTEQARKDTEKAIVKFNYNDGATFSDAVQNLVKDNGNNVFFNNIGTANAVVFTPYSWEEYASIENAIEPGWARKSNPDPTKRYGYFIGPGIIQTLSRTYEWQPPQKSQEITAMMNRKAEELKDAKKKDKEKDRQRTSAQQSATAATATSGIYGSNISQNIRSENNEDGPRKQDTFTKERAAKLSLSTLMCPALTGLKPLDIIFIPSFNEEFIEDWIVSSVEYQQNEKGVDLSIQATRPVGQGEPMSPKNSERYLDGYAQLAGLSKSSSSKEDKLVNWMNFAWSERLKSTRLVDAVPQTTSTPPQPEATPDGSVSTISADQILETYKPKDPSNSITVIGNPNRYKAPGSNSAPGVAYKINDPLYGKWLLNQTSNEKSYVIYEGKTKEDYILVGNQTINSTVLIKNYQTFLKQRQQFAEYLASKAVQPSLQQPSADKTSQKTAESPLLKQSGAYTVSTDTGGTTGANAPTAGAVGTTNTTGAGAETAIPQPIPVPNATQVATGGLSLPELSYQAKSLPPPSPSNAIYPIVSSNGGRDVASSHLPFNDWLILKKKSGANIRGTFNVQNSRELIVREGGRLRIQDLYITGGDPKQLQELYFSKEFQDRDKFLRNYGGGNLF